MVNWDNLSPEILQIIFKHIYSDDQNAQTLCQCQQVCKGWSRSAQSELYNDVTLKSDLQLAAFLNTVSTSTDNPGRFVKKIIIYNVTKNPQVERTMYKTFAKFCPNTELFEESTTEAFWSSLHDERVLGHWQRLTALPEYDYELEEQSCYRSTALVFRSTLQELTIYDNLGRQLLDKGKYEFQNNILYESLHTFDCLRALKLKIVTNQKNLYQMDVIFNDLPTATIKKLLIETEETDTEKFMHTLMLNDRRMLATESSEQLDLSLIEPCPNIQEMEIDSVICSDAGIQYIIHKFPGLRKLELNRNFNMTSLRRMYFIADLFKLSENTMLQLINYLLQLNTFSIYIPINNMIDFVNQLAATGRYSNLNYEFEFGSYSLFMKGYPFIENTIQGRREHIYNTIDLVGNRNKKGLHNLSFHHIAYKDNKEDIQTSVIDTLERLGNVVDTLDLNFDDEDETINIPDVFDYNQVLKFCTNLKKLYISSARFNGCNQGQLIINNSITELNLDCCYIETDAYYQLSMQLRNLKVLKVDVTTDHHNLQIDKNSEDQTHVVVLNLPYTSFEILSYVGSGKDSDRFSDLCIKIDMPTENRFYFGSTDLKLKECTAEDFESAALYDGRVLCFDIRCKKFKRFKLNYQGFTGSCEFDGNQTLKNNYV
ncbi:uncharacterized protein BX663DRAFT_508701 [Cokeromyces recurvatus]|uniref:uncharacterized protein n=1 Tax=Cokeromyces recurvatus TaxID=90255 RepID=UPI00222091F9|nr:uncharacterized protein BX663DRAFT_508701 [Cokeromyces recurvatus]KAI7902869.1 hypothetical protein BX663DRAFT_508701 [Cokeromyces recurvatus]